MSKQKTQSGIDRRGENTAIFGLLVSLLATGILVALAIWGHSEAPSVWAVAFQAFAGVGIWILCWLQQHQRRLILEEQLELDRIERDRQEKLGGVQTIFEEEELDQMDALASGRRYRAIQKFVVPTVALIVAVYMLVAGFTLIPPKYSLIELSFSPLTMAKGNQLTLEGFAAERSGLQNYVVYVLFFAAGISFVAFMMSRYALGLRKVRGFNSLSAGGNHLFGTSALALGLALAMTFVVAGFYAAEYWYSVIVGVVLILLGLEQAASFIMNFYRPRGDEEDPHPYFDSRLWGVFSEPGGVVESTGKFLDYQFGFKVSETWFYKLLSWQLPILLLLQVAIIFGLTMITVVPPGHQAVITHFGEPREATAKPGMHITWPWPIDRAAVIPVERIQRMVLGHEVETKDEVDNLGDNIAGALAGEKGKAKNSNAVFLRSETILWTKQHYKNEYKLIVPDRIRFDVGDEPNNGTRVSDEQLPVNLLSVSMPVQWRIRPGDAEVIKFHRQSQDAAAIVEALAYRELTRYAANADIKEFLGDGGLAAASIIHERLQEACDAGGYSNEGLGIEIVYVGLGGIHPPPDQDVAKSYESVVSAIERKETLIKKATAEANELRIEMAGLNWEEIYSAVVDEEKARRTEAADAEEKTDAVVTLLREQSGGNVREMVSAAESSSYARLFNEKSSAELYDAQVASYNAGPHTYLLRVYLRTIEDAIRPVRKYVVAMANPENVIYEIDLKPPSELNIMNAEIAKVDATQTDLDGN